MFARLIAAIAAVAISMPAIAQGSSSHAVTVIVPFAAGGPMDTIMQTLGPALSKALGAPVHGENVGGHGGTEGVERVAHSKADGYTVLMMNVGIAASVSMYPHLPYDPVKDLDPVGLVADVPMVIIARADFAPHDAKELNAYVKANSDRVTLANAGMGSASHLCELLYLHALDADVTTVPYKGTGPAMSDLIDGQVDVMCDQSTNAIPRLRSGKIRAYAVTTSKRVPSLPELPTLAESGLRGFDIANWIGLWVPHGTRKADIDKLQAALQVALKDPVVASRFAELGVQLVTPDRATPAALRDRLASEIARWSAVVRKIGATSD